MQKFTFTHVVVNTIPGGFGDTWDDTRLIDLVGQDR
jgi:hypothetical protein